MQKLYIESLFLNAYQTPDMAIFIKNINSQYLWANDFFIRKSAGYQLANEIYHKHDHDFVWSDYADELILNDQTLFEKGQTISVCERILRHEGRYVDIVSKKCPLFDNKQNMVGLIGFSMELPHSPTASLLSKREYDAVLLMSEGHTDKQIARIWGVSPRTVESHIINAKEKLGVASRAELIVKFCRGYP